MSSSTPRFTFIDLFAGIGGFHAALSELGGECVYASEIDEAAAKIYQHNWNMPVAGDIVPETDPVVKVPPHDVLAAGFPCQPFSKSGFQRGMDEARGTLFWNILRILEEHRPSIVLLENVRNIAGPRHTHEWDVIISSLRDLGYQVSSTPAVFSPHLLPPWMGGSPQIRERVFIVGTYVGDDRAQDEIEPVVVNRPIEGWNPQDWKLSDILQDESEIADRANYDLTATEQHWVHVWSEFVLRLRAAGVEKLPGFPVWVDAFIHSDDLVISPELPAWKKNFLRKNAEFYTEHSAILDPWLEEFDDLADLPASRRKFEWQAQDSASLEDCIMHFRPSGIRVKRPTYVPALVAITQTTILGKPLRRITPREAARLQGLPDWFDFPGQPDALTYKQLGNGVNVGVVSHVARAQMERSGDQWASVLEAASKNTD
ncbi:modification methylase HhaI [Aeromicrobium marinum DSM 15272]|uniref:Cytosine-specific methyltransferase n=1 Tax=Aeromicrobium marinum DSM 15272 TaxID=585531 RepID=E2S905_9ACTN|nr:DNA cytosine methyltransferase [Aeromicrobium marinum]EFQ84275.1 modification methylase HhaI [Aeromicrobium marinum DSM 15272]